MSKKVKAVFKVRKKENPTLPQFEKDGFPDFMRKEIFVQGELVSRFLAKNIKGDKIKFDYLKLKTDKIKRVYIIGSGESYGVIMSGAYNFEVICDVVTVCELISEFNCSNPVLDKSTLVIIVSQDDSSQEYKAALSRMEESGARFISILDFAPENANAISLDFSGRAQYPTASNTLRSIALIILSLYIGRKNQVITKPYIRLALASLFSFEERVKALLSNEFIIKQVAQVIDGKRVVITGTNVDFAAAAGAANLLDKIPCVYAKAAAYGELERTNTKECLVIYLSSNSGFYKMLGSRSVSLIIAPECLCEMGGNILSYPDSMPLLNPILSSIVFQLIYYHLARMHSIELDRQTSVEPDSLK